MRTMYDAVTAANIPANARVVAGYVDQIVLKPWSSADWGRFPNAVKVQIVKKASSNFGHVLDVETGDALPSEAPGWVLRRRAAGLATPYVYCNSSTWPAVKAEFAKQNVAPPLYWIAKYDNNPTVPAGAFMKQYANNAAFDTSSVPDFLPGIETPAVPGSTTKAEVEMNVLPASPGVSKRAFALPGQPCRITVTPGRDASGAVVPIFMGSLSLRAGYSPKEGSLGVLKPQQLDAAGNHDPAGRMLNPEIFDLSTKPLIDATEVLFTYSSGADASFVVTPA